MAQPPGLVDKSRPNHVCRLKRAIYGLKQAPRVWYQSLSTFLLTLGFKQSVSDASLFVFHQDDLQMYILVYVDDIIITGSSHTAIRKTINALAAKFSLKDLGSLHFFLGVQIHPCANGLLLSQSHYIHNILLNTKMQDAKPISTPMASSFSTATSSSPFSDPTLFRQVIGSLQYLQLSRPDIAFAVNRLAQRMQSPTEDDCLL